MVVVTALLHAGADGSAEVEYRAFGEVRLVRPLHLDDEVLLVLVNTKQIEHRPSFGVVQTILFCRQIGYIRDDTRVLGDEAVEEVDEEAFVRLCSEDFLESEIRGWNLENVLVFCHNYYVLINE